MQNFMNKYTAAADIYSNIKNSLSTLWSTLIFPGDEYNGMTHSVKIRVSKEM